jgi:hypothetical protein
MAKSEEVVDDREQKIRDRAYEIWLTEGQPEGHEGEHWSRAAQELGFEDAAPGGANEQPKTTDDSSSMIGGVSPGQVLPPD